MWMTNTTHMLARLAGSTLCANHHLVSIFGFDHCSLSTTTEQSSDNDERNRNIITKMRDLRASSPYAIFVKDNYNDISMKYPELKMTDVSKKLAEVWKNLSNDKKQTYYQQYRDRKVNYDQEKKLLSSVDLQTVTADEKARRIENQFKKNFQSILGKKPRTAYAHFLTTLDRGEAPIGDFSKGAAQQWSQMAIQDKQKFEKLHQEEKEQYIRALVAWAETTNKKKTERDTSKKSSISDRKALKKGRSNSSKKTVSVLKSRKTKSSTKKSDKNDLSSSSSDDELSSKIK